MLCVCGGNHSLRAPSAGSESEPRASASGSGIACISRHGTSTAARFSGRHPSLRCRGLRRHRRRRHGRVSAARKGSPPLSSNRVITWRHGIGGLGWTDYGKKEVIGGYALEFYLRSAGTIDCRYTDRTLAGSTSHTAEDTFRQMLAEAGVHLFERSRLKEKSGVGKTAPR